MQTDIPSAVCPAPTLTVRDGHNLHLHHSSLLTIRTPSEVISSTATNIPPHVLLFFLITSRNNNTTRLLTLKLPYPIPPTFPETLNLTKSLPSGLSLTVHKTHLPQDFHPAHILPPTHYQRQKYILLLTDDHFRTLRLTADVVPDSVTLSPPTPYARRTIPLVPTCSCTLPYNHALRSEPIGGRNGTASTGFAVVVGDAAGNIWVASGGYDVLGENGREEGRWKRIGGIGTMGKWVGIVGGFVVAMGELGRGLVVDGGGRVKLFWVREDGSRVEGRGLEGGDGVVVRDVVVRFRKDAEDGGEVLRKDVGGDVEKTGTELKELLKAIDSAAYWCGVVNKWNRKWEERVKGLSRAMLQKMSVGECGIEVNVTGSCRGRGAEWAGGEVGICVSVTNKAEMKLGEGWGLQVCVKQKGDKLVSRYYNALKSLESRDSQQCVFPFCIKSHNPLHIDVTLVYHTLPSQSNEDLPVISIDKSPVTLDILHCAQRSLNTSPSLDYSRNVLPFSRLNAAFSGAMPGPSRLQTLRLRLASSASAFDDVAGTWETGLGAQIVIETIQRNDKDCTLIVRAAYHVLPFVRAALLRRVLDKDAQIVQEKRERSSGDSINQGRKAVVSATDTLVQAFRALGVDPRSSERSVECNQSSIETLSTLKSKVLGAYEAWRECTPGIL